ncbi:MAG: ABC transporter substrate-binding protein [Bacillota bacterium]|nr:ABC transporter substrate-binding protein [Bacillota bacterium]
MKKLLLTLITAVLVAALMAGCAISTPNETPTQTVSLAFPKKVVDIQGTEVEIKANPQRIISLSASTTEILFALGAGDRIVGVDDFSNYPNETANIEKVGDFTNGNIEKIVSLDPDLVLAGETLQTDTINKLRELDIPTMAVEARSYEEVASSFEIIGAAVGKEAEAADLADTLKAKEEEIKAKKPTVYFVYSYGEYGNWTSGPGSFINSIIEIAGGHPVTNDVTPNAPWMDYTLETLVSQDPDVLLVSADAGDVEALKQAEGYKSLSAVKNGKVYVLGDEIVRPGPRLIDAMADVAQMLYPDLFE